MARKQVSPTEPRVTFWGATQGVTGSMHRVDAQGYSLLLDCGLYQGRRAESFRRNREFPFRPRDIDAVLLSHAHVDHCGNLPNLVRQGFKGPIYCTSATPALAAVMLGDSAKIQEEDADYLNRKREKGEPKVEPLYDGRDVYRTLLRFKAVPYDKSTEIAPQLVATFVDAGHLLGSAMIGLRLGERRLTFTGDLGRPGLPILREPSAVPPGDLLISESTYGGHTHEPVEETAERLGEVVRRTVGARRQGHHPGVQRRPHANDRLLSAPTSAGQTAAGGADLRRQPDGGASDRGVPFPSRMLQRTILAVAGGAARPVRRRAGQVRRQGP